ncbi:hypothetical protein ACPCTO_27710 [Streptomyces olivoreticuli]
MSANVARWTAPASPPGPSAQSGSRSLQIRRDPKGCTTGAEDTLAATLKQLQQVQDAKRATATAGDEAAKAVKR